MATQSELDFVVSWVDGNDPAWLLEKAQYLPNTDMDARSVRYRDWGLLRYWFRSVETFAPWVRTIHFVTWGHVPDWLDRTNPKLHIVRHEEFIPAEYLPTFNSHTIEFCLDRIKGLSERFVYFNDDFFLLRPIKPSYFFRRGLPCDMLALQPVVANPKNPVMSSLYLNNSLVLAKYFKKYETMRKHPGQYFHLGYPPKYFIYNLLETAFPLFTGFYTVHSAFPLTKQVYRTLWEAEPELLAETCRHRFRSAADVTPYLLREWQKLSGEFYPVNAERGFRYFEIGATNQALVKTITQQRASVICINDGNDCGSFEAAKEEIIQAFETRLHQKSSFER